jgi:hypothetical protein
LACLVPHYRIITFNLNREALPALAAATVDYTTTVLGGHACTETVGALPFDVRRLVSALHAILLLDLEYVNLDDRK